MICFPCPSCGESLKVADEAAGKIGKCKCGERVRVPTPNPFEQAMEQRCSPKVASNTSDTRTAPSLIPPLTPSISPLTASHSTHAAPFPNKIKKSRKRAGLFLGLIAGAFVIVILAVTLVKIMRNGDQHAEGISERLMGSNGQPARNVQRRPKTESLKEFVIIAKQIRTGLAEGISFKDFDEKQIKLRDTYALIDKDVLDTSIGRKVEAIISSAKELRETWRKHIYESEYVSWLGLLQSEMTTTGLRIDDFLEDWDRLGVK